jgi:hypothetical protein
VPTSQQAVQRLSLGLQQKLQAEQRPLLSLKAEARAETRTELRTDLRLLFSLEHRLISMTPEEMLDFVVSYVMEHGEDRAKNVLLFTIAGKVKRVMPKLTWREARQLARNMTQVPKSA